MICKECGNQNITKAQYCACCGSAFNEDERVAAYRKTIYGKIEKLEELKGYVTFEVVTEHPAFRIAIIVLILVWGLLLGRSNGNEMTILESDAYTVQQHAQTGDYYVLTGEERVDLSLYLPKEAESIKLQQMRGDEVIYEATVAEEEALQLEQSGDTHYIIQADYGSTSESIKLYVVTVES